MSLLDLRNLGPQSAKMLREVGIEDQQTLIALGATAAYARVKFQFGRHATLNLLWALHGAIHNCDWRTLDQETKDELKKKLKIKID